MKTSSKRKKTVKSSKPAKKGVKTVFVIMPFTKTPTRDFNQLSGFFRDHLKKEIESTNFKYKYFVERSDDTFNITEKIILNLYNADIVLCDLSGIDSNPNVMYELGVRLGITENPVILFREKHIDNKPIFDVGGFYAYFYDPLNYEPLLSHIIDKIKKFEKGDEKYKSPVLEIIKKDIPLLKEFSLLKASEMLLFMQKSIQIQEKMFLYEIMRFNELNAIEFDFGNSLSQVINKIQEKSDDFLKIDYREFHFDFSSQPTIDAYLSDQYLNNIIEVDIVYYFTMYIIHYHATILGSDVFDSKWNSVKIYKYFGETNILDKMIDQIILRLRSTDENLILEITDKMKSYYEESQILM